MDAGVCSITKKLLFAGEGVSQATQIIESYYRAARWAVPMATVSVSTIFSLFFQKKEKKKMVNAIAIETKRIFIIWVYYPGQFLLWKSPVPSE